MAVQICPGPLLPLLCRSNVKTWVGHMPAGIQRVPRRTPDILGNEAEVHFEDGFVVRRAIREERGFNRPALPTEAFHRYYAHKIARELINPAQGEILDIQSANANNVNTSREVSRSAALLEYNNAFYRPHEAPRGGGREKHHQQLKGADQNIRAAAYGLYRFGVEVNTHPVNIDVLPDGRARFFEAHVVNFNLLRSRLRELPAAKRKRVRNLLERYYARMRKRPPIPSKTNQRGRSN